MEELGDDPPLLIGDIYPGKGDAMKKCVVEGDLVIQDPILPDHLGVDIGKQRIGDLLVFGELSKCLLVVIRDRVELDSVGLELVEGVAQLTELRPAGGSPHGRAIEDHDRPGPRPILVQPDPATVRVGQVEIGQ
jgi:hypothetical protein